MNYYNITNRNIKNNLIIILKKKIKIYLIKLNKKIKYIILFLNYLCFLFYYLFIKIIYYIRKFI